VVEFRCKRSGNTVAFSDPNDIESMRKHEGYEEVKHEKANEAVKVPQAPKAEVLKKRGRPRKEVMEI